MTNNKLDVIRDLFLPDCTMGKLYLNGEYVCETLEDFVREIPDTPVLDWKIKGYTAIPTGKYKLTLSMSNRFGKILPELHSVPGFEGVRIHSGNTSADTEGCILLGLFRLKSSVTSSRHAMMAFMSKIDKLSNLTIEIKGLPEVV